MAGRFFVLRQVSDFAPGLFENTSMEEDGVQLSRRGSGFVPEGQYTSPPFPAEAFFSLIPSWNADTPPGTTVEMQVRVSVDGGWSGWFGFGAWSPYGGHASPPPQQDELARTEGENLSLQDGRPGADKVQMRALLATANSTVSPSVRQLAVSTNAPQQMGTEVTVFDRDLELPSYACLTRDPALAGRIAGATTLTMMMNRWGRDLLPEEVARAAYDDTGARYGNLALLCAVAGAQGFSSRVAYASIALLRNEVWQGRTVAARVHYRAPALDGTPAEESQVTLPELKGAVTGSTGHLVAVRGFSRRDDQDLVLFHDPLAQSDAAVLRAVPLSDFARIYTGLAILLDKGPKGAGHARPRRTLARLDTAGGMLRMFDDAGELTRLWLEAEGLLPATLCYTLSDNVAYASAAQRRFYYPAFDEDGVLRFDAGAATGRKMTLYLLASKGAAWVAEKRL